jgi:thiamine biosynthesis lipoprotein
MDALLSPRRRRLLVALGASALAAGCGRRVDSGAPTLRFGGHSMGTTWSVRMAGGPFDPALEATAQQAVRAALDGVVERMSTYDPASEIGRFNRHAATTAFALSSDTRSVIERALQAAQLSDGAFDPTVAPLVRAWGFGAGASARGQPPATAELDTPLGWRHLSVEPAQGIVRKSLPGLQLDLSGIAKGHAVDLAAQALDALGVSRYMVEAGGEIRTLGLNAEGRPWQIAVERPDAWPPRAHRVVPLQGLAIATSGDYRNFWEHGGRRIHHEIDPATRAPAAHRVASVSVVHAECRLADALATALFVMGPERGLALAHEQRLAALFIMRESGGTLRDLASPAFAALG